MIRIAINGFGRIGRNILRAFYEQPHYKSYIEIVAINDLAKIEHSFHLLKYDSVHGKFSRNMSHSENSISINNHKIPYYSIKEVEKLPWKDLNVDLVFDCTGKFTTKEKALGHINAGAKKVLVSAPCENADKTVVYGMNDDLIDINDLIISNASCTTNCLAPILGIIHEEYNVSNALMTTIHSYTGDQRLIDTDHSDLFRARAANLSMIPSKTGAAKAIGLIIPELNGKVNGMAVRVPTPNVSLVDLTCVINKNVSKDDINNLFKNKVEQKVYKGIIGYNSEDLVSIDFNHSHYSSIFDSKHTMVNDNIVKVMAWYDNEWGFSNRMLDVAISILKQKAY